MNKNVKKFHSTYDPHEEPTAPKFPAVPDYTTQGRPSYAVDYPESNEQTAIVKKQEVIVEKRETKTNVLSNRSTVQNSIDEIVINKALTKSSVEDVKSEELQSRDGQVAPNITEQVKANKIEFEDQTASNNKAGDLESI